MLFTSIMTLLAILLGAKKVIRLFKNVSVSSERKREKKRELSDYFGLLAF